MNSIRTLRAAVKNIGGHLQLFTLTGGRLCLTVAFATDSNDGVQAIGCLTDSRETVNDAASLLLALLALRDEPHSLRPKELERKLVAARCDVCDQPIIFAVGSDPPAGALCPPCAARERRTERLSLALRLSWLQSAVNEVASAAPAEISISLASALGELDRLQQTLSRFADT
jgi:hypothetical protein